MDQKKIQFSFSSSSGPNVKRQSASIFFNENKVYDKDKHNPTTATISNLSDLEKPIPKVSKKIISLSPSNIETRLQSVQTHPPSKNIATSSSKISQSIPKYGLLVPITEAKGVERNEHKPEQRSQPLLKASRAAYSYSNTTLEDYEEMPVSDFGAAMLRGMGFDSDIDPQQKIQSSTKQPRPGFLGLGADPSNIDLVKKKAPKLDCMTKLFLANSFSAVSSRIQPSYLKWSFLSQFRPSTSLISRDNCRFISRVGYSPIFLLSSSNANFNNIRATSFRSYTLNISTTMSHANGNSKNDSSDTFADPQAAYWLFVCAGLVFGIVVVGGITRLTESGLSMVDWSLLHFKPPSTGDEWIEYFERYKQSPDLNGGMSLDEFKKIYYMEYSHRMLGRLIGAVFLLPLPYFWWTRKTSFTLATKISLSLTGSLILFQGFLGWYMVRSGLDPEIIERQETPRVSHYRLAAHLTTAFAIYLLLLRTGFSLLNPRIISSFDPSIVLLLKNAKKKVSGSVHFVALTAVSGAFVAGLDAGMIYNTFPKMGINWIPDDLCPPNMLPFDNPTAVQFVHRILAISSISYISIAWLFTRSRLLPRMVNLSSRNSLSKAINLFFVAGISQVTLGISTLLWIVPIPVAALHQAGSLVLLSTGSWLLYLLKRLVH